MRALFCLACLLMWSSCATMNGKGDVEQLKPTVENFHQKLRWKDFRAAADFLVPERRESFIKARVRSEDERDLFVTDFQLEDATTSADGMSARVVSKLSWYRLPSNKEQSAVLTSVFVWRNQKWLLESQDEGPFPDLLGPPPERKAAENSVPMR